MGTYLLPIRRARFCANETTELRDYFACLQQAGFEVLVVDGSPSEIFAKHDEAWSDMCTHCQVDCSFGYLNDKVNGIHTGIRLASHELIVLADDDIRYRPDEVPKICGLLDHFEVVRPQNYFGAQPNLSFWARMEAARMLINRATLRTGDYPGTCAFRRDTMLRAGEYDGDVLFDNEELVRHFARSGARICYATDFFIRKCPPRFRKWLEQRPRQAYEDFNLRFKTILFTVLLPLAVLIVITRAVWLLIFLLPIVIAFAGWCRGSARKYFPWHICLFGPLWILERSISTWWAFYWRLTRGGYPFGEKLLSRGIGRDWIEGGRIGAKLAANARFNSEQGSQNSGARTG